MSCPKCSSEDIREGTLFEDGDEQKYLICEECSHMWQDE